MTSKRLLSKRRNLKACYAWMLGAGMLLVSSDLFAQVKIGNNPTTLNANAALDVESTTRGILFPRLSLTSLVSPAPLTAHVAGMHVYNTNTNADVEPGTYYNDGTKWIRVGGETEKVFYFGSGAPSGSCTVGTMYVDTLENSATEGDTWTCIAGAWQSYTPPPTPSTTPFYITRTTTDAKGNKGSGIYRLGAVGLGVTNPKATFHVAGRILITKDGATGTGMPIGTHAQGGMSVLYSPGASGMSIQNSNFVTNLSLTKKTSAVGDPFMRFWVNGVLIASITRTAGGVSYNTTSDVRLKENIKPTHYGVSDQMKIQVKDYNFIADKKTPNTGFIAQQLYEIFPDAVTVGGKDAKTNPWAVDYGKVTPLLVKAIQDQQVEIISLKAQLAQKDASNMREVAAVNARLDAMQAKLAQLVTPSEKSATTGK